MQFEFIERPFPHIIVRDFYNEIELSDIWKELEFLTNDRSLKSPEDTNSATTLDGVIKKNNHGVWIDSLYTDRKISNILTHSRKIFDLNFITKASFCHFVFKNLVTCDNDSILMSYYEDSNYYKSHIDNAALTVLTNFYKEPKCFTGGDLIFETHNNYTIPVENNRVIIIPSVIEHAVSAVKMDSNNLNGFGRYTLAHFIKHR
jgi:Rps23 Pro-64 3,4-dihydroxylase Tpa1-like proline 4-hydroxylase